MNNDKLYFTSATTLRGNNKKIDKLNDALQHWHHVLIKGQPYQEAVARDLIHVVQMLNDEFPRTKPLRATLCYDHDNTPYLFVNIDGTDIGCTLHFKPVRRTYPDK